MVEALQAQYLDCLFGVGFGGKRGRGRGEGDIFFFFFFQFYLPLIDPFPSTFKTELYDGIFCQIDSDCDRWLGVCGSTGKCVLPSLEEVSFSLSLSLYFLNIKWLFLFFRWKINF